MFLICSKRVFKVPFTEYNLPEYVRFGKVKLFLGEECSYKLQRACFAEFLAMMFFVVLCCGCAMVTLNLPNPNLMMVASSFGFGIMVLAQFIGPLSGGHINNAVSLALFVGGRVSFVRMFCYTLSQMCGSVLGAFFLWVIFGSEWPAARAFGSNSWDENVFTGGQVFLAEMMGTMLLVYNVFATIDIPSAGGGSLGVFPIAMAVMVAHLFLLPIDGCSINPARSFGPSLVAAMAGINGKHNRQQYMFWFAPLIGAALTAVIYEYAPLKPKKRETKEDLSDAIFLANKKRDVCEKESDITNENETDNQVDEEMEVDISETLDEIALVAAEYSFIGIGAYLGVLSRLLISAGLSSAVSADSFAQAFQSRPFVLCNMLGCAITAFVNTCKQLHVQAERKKTDEDVCEEKHDERDALSVLPSTSLLSDDLKEDQTHASVDGPSVPPNSTTPLIVKHKQMVPQLLSAVTVGYCGCLSTYSAWIVSFLLQRAPISFNIVDLLIEVALCGAAWYGGVMLAELVYSISNVYVLFSSCAPHQRSDTDDNGNTNCIGGEQVDSLALFLEKNTRTLRDASSLVFSLSFLALWVFIAAVDRGEDDSLKRIFEKDMPVENLSVWQGLRSIALAPVGAFVRFTVRRSAIWRRLLLSFPLCTWSCNFSGVVFAALLVVFARENSWTAPLIAGFAGSLTTVSTFYADLVALHSSNGALGSWYALRYGLLTVLPTLLVVELMRLV